MNTVSNTTLSKASVLKYLRLTLNNIVVASTPKNLLSLKIQYGKIGVYGELEFEDTNNSLELCGISSSFMSISTKDFNGYTFEQTFRVTRASIVRSVDGKQVVKVDFEDWNRYALKKSNIAHGFSDSFIEGLGHDFTFNDVFIEVANKLKLDNIIIDEPHKSAAVYENFVIPSNISAYNFVEKKLQEDNFLIYSDRSSMRLTNYESLSFKDLPLMNNTYTYNVEEQNNIFRVLEVNGVISDTKDISLIPSVEYLHNFDSEDIKYDPEITSLEDNYKENEVNKNFLFGNTTLPDAFTFNGVRERAPITSSSKAGFVDDDFSNLINSQSLNIYVTGINIDRMYNKVNVYFTRLKTQGSATADTLISGAYVITGIQDIYVENKFLQILTLSRSDYSKGNEVLKGDD